MNWKHERYCESFMYGDGDESFWDYFSVTDQDENEVAKVDDEENANLISAAPELLAALRDIVGASTPFHSALEIDQEFDGEALYSNAVKAIKKATGE